MTMDVTPYQRGTLSDPDAPVFSQRRAGRGTCGVWKGAKDEGEAWCSHGGSCLVEGERRNMKITWPEDLPCGVFHVEDLQTGLGYDVHPSSREGLGGVTIPEFPRRPRHSDGDPVVHALCDALLGAAGLGDIGTLYPAGDEAYKGIKSLPS